MDEEEFKKLLQQSHDRGLNKIAEIPTNSGPKTIQTIQKEKKALAKNQASDLEKAGGKSAEQQKWDKMPLHERNKQINLFYQTGGKEGQKSPYSYKTGAFNNWATNFGLKAAAMVLDFSHLFDVGDWHNYMPEAIKSKTFNPLYGISKAIDELGGDEENLEVGNWVANFGKTLRKTADRYYTDYGDFGKKKIPIIGWSVEKVLNGSADIGASIVGVAATGGPLRYLAGKAIGSGMAANTAARTTQFISLGAMTMAVSGSIGSDVFDNVEDHWLEKDSVYKSLKDEIYTQSVKEFYEEKPNAEEWEVRAYADAQQDIFKEKFTSDPKNSELVKNAKKNAIIGADVALKTNFVFGLATNYLMGKIISAPLFQKVNTATTRKFSEILKKDGTKAVKKNKTFFEKHAAKGEGIMEALEESVFESLSQKRGELAGKGKEYGFSDAFGEFTADEFWTSAVFGYAGGHGTAAYFGYMDRNSPEAKAELEAAKKQIEEFNVILEASGGLNLKEVSYLAQSSEELVSLMKQAKNLAAEGKTDEAKAIHKKIVGLQALAAFETGTTEKLKDTYTYIANDKRNDEQTRNNAIKTLAEINELEGKYLEIYNSKKLNKKQLFVNRINKNFAKKQLTELDLEISKKKTEVLTEIATKTGAGKMASLDVKRTTTEDQGKGEMPIIKQVEETLDFDTDDLSKDTKKKFDNDESNQTYGAYKKQVSKFESAKQLQELQKRKKETLEYVSKTDDDFDEMSSKKYQNKLKVEKRLLEDYGHKRYDILQNIIGKSKKQAETYIDKVFSKYKEKTFEDSYNNVKSKILKEKKQLERAQKQEVQTTAAAIVNDSRSKQPLDERTSIDDEANARGAKDAEEKVEVKNQTDPTTDENLRADSQLDVANKTNNPLGKGLTKEQFDQQNFDINYDGLLDDDADADKEEISENYSAEDDEDWTIDKGALDDSAEDTISDILTDLSNDEIPDSTEDDDYTDLGYDYSRVELDSDADKSELENLSKLLTAYKKKKDRAGDAETSFKDLLEDFIAKTSKDNTKDKFYALKDAWKIAGFTINEDLNEIYEDLFVDVGDLVLQINEQIDITSTTAIEDSKKDGKLDADVNQNNEVVPKPPVKSKEGKFSIDVHNNAIPPQFAYLSINNEFSTDEDGKYGARVYVNPSQLNPDSELDNPHDLLNYLKYLPGEELTIEAISEEDWNKIPIVVYDIEGLPVKQANGKTGILFGKWVKDNGIVPGSKEFIDKIPMVIRNKEGETVAYVRDSGWINPFNFDSTDISNDDIQAAKEENDAIRAAVYNNKDKKETIVITSKSNGVWDAAVEAGKEFENDADENPTARSLTVAEAAGWQYNDNREKEVQTQIAVYSLKQGYLQLANGKKIYKEQLTNSEFPTTVGKTGSIMFNYDVRKEGFKINEKGEKVQQYTAYTTSGSTSHNKKEFISLMSEMLKLNVMYELSKAASVNKEVNEDGTPKYTDAQKAKYRAEVIKYETEVFPEILENTGYDFTAKKFAKSGIIGLLESYIRIKEVDIKKAKTNTESIEIIKQKALDQKSGIKVGESFIYKAGGVLYFGNKFKNSKTGKTTIGGLGFINLNANTEKGLEIFNAKSKNGNNFRRTLSKLVPKQSLDTHALTLNKKQVKSVNSTLTKDDETGALVFDVQEVQYKEGNYQDILFNTLESNVKAYNIGTTEEPFMVTRIQPVITYELKSKLAETSPKESINAKIEQAAKDKVELENIEGAIADTEENLEEETVVELEPTVETEPATIEDVNAEIEEKIQKELDSKTPVKQETIVVKSEIFTDGLTFTFTTHKDGSVVVRHTKTGIEPMNTRPKRFDKYPTLEEVNERFFGDDEIDIFELVDKKTTKKNYDDENSVEIKKSIEKSIRAKYKAEPVAETATTEEVEAQKAEIEERRQEAENNPVSEPEEYAKAVDEYKQTELGGSENAKTKKENLVKQAQTKEGKAFVENQVAQLDYNEDGTITVYRSGTIQEGHNPATTDKKTAELISSERKKQGLSSDIIEIKVQPSDISAIVPGAESEVLIHVNKDNAKRVKENTKKEQKTKVQLESERENVKNELEKTTQALENAKKDKLDGTFAFSDNVYNDVVKKQEAKIKNLEWQLKKYDAELATLETEIIDDANKRKEEEAKLKDLKEREKELKEKPKAKLTPEQLSNNRIANKKIEDLNDQKENLEIELDLATNDKKKQNIEKQVDNINDEVTELESQVAKPEEQNLDDGSYTDEEIEELYEKSEDLLAYDNDDDFDQSPVELTEGDVQRISEDLFRIEGVNPSHQTQLANHIYHETSKILTEYEGVIEKTALRNMLDENFLNFLETKIAVFEKNKAIFETVNTDKARAYVEKYNKAIDYLNLIKSNSDIIVDEGLSIARREIGINETKEERDAAENPEVDLENTVEKDHSKTFLEEGGKDKITYKLKRFFSDIPSVTSEGDLVKGIFGVQEYIPFDEMFNTVQSILANTYPNFDKMIDKLSLSKNKNPGIKALIEKLKNADKQTQNQFVTTMSKNNTGMQFISISTVKNKETNEISYYLDIYDTNSANVSRKIRNRWYNRFQINPIVDFKQGKLFINKEKAKKVLEDFDKAKGALPRINRGLDAFFNKQILTKNLSFKSPGGVAGKVEANTNYIFKTKKGVFYTVFVDANKNITLSPYVEKPGSFDSLFAGKYSKAAADNFNKLLNNFGINLSYKTIEHLTEKGLYITKGDVRSLDVLFKEDSEMNIFGSLIKYLRDNITEKKDEEGNVVEQFFDKETNNPLANSVFGALATLEAKYNSDMVLPTSFRDGKKTLQQYTASKFLTDRILDLASETDPSIRNKLRQSSFSKHSYLLHLLDTNPNLRHAFSVQYLGLNSIKERGLTPFKATGITTISSADSELVRLGFFMNHRLSSSQADLEYRTQFGQVFSMRMAQMVSPTMSDKSTATAITMPIFNFSKEHFIGLDGDIELSNSVTNLMYEQILVPEIQRMFDFHKLAEKPDIKGYSKDKRSDNKNIGATKFLDSPLANVLKAKITVDGKVKTITLPQLIEYMANNSVGTGNKTIHEFIASTDFGRQIKEMFNSYVKNEFADTVKNWEDFGIINYDENNTLSVKGIDKRYLNNRKKFPKEENISLDAKVKTLALDFIVNSMISNSNIFMTMVGDPAMYYKSNSPDPVQQAKDTFENMGKRLANQIAPGIKPADAKDNQYFQIFLEDINASASNLKYLAKVLEVEDFEQKEIDQLNKALSENNNDVIKKLKKKFPKLAPYFQIEGTDAQEYTTWKEHLYLLEKLGKTSPELFDFTPAELDAARALLENNTPFSQMSDKQKKLVKLVMQPMKPVYTGQIYDNDAKTMRTIYIKSSSIPLIPQFTKGLEIDVLRKAMEKMEAETIPKDKDGKPIPGEKPTRTVRASYNSGNKVGALSNTAKLFNNGTTSLLKDSDVDSLLTRLKGSRLLLDRNNFRIQQEVPFKSGKRKEDYVKQGTQTTKLLLGDGITDLDGFLYNGNPDTTGKELKEAFTDNFGKLLTLMKKQLLQQLSIDATTGKSTNPRVTANKLQELLKEEAESRGYSKQVIDSLGVDLIVQNGVVIDYEFTLPLWMSAESNRFESLLNSIATNRISKIKMPGNTYVASSQEGFKEVVKGRKGDPSKIIYTSSWTGELRGAEFDADGNLKKTQVFLPSKFRTNDGKMLNMFAKDSEGKYIYVKQKEEGGPFMLNEEMFDKELLSNISFRTPTSAHLSMADIEIVGFLPYECGDLIVVPRNLTVQIGLDFDIDKQTNYQYHHEVDSDGKVIILKDNIEDVEAKIKYNDELLEREKYEQKQEEYFIFKEKLKEERKERKRKISEFKKFKSDSQEEVALLIEDAKEIYTEIEFLLTEITEAKKDLASQKSKEGKEEYIKLLKKLYKDKKAKHTELAKTNNRIQELTGNKITKKELSEIKDTISENYKQLDEKREKLKELNVIARNTTVYEKRLEKLYKNEIVKIHSSVLSNPQVEVQGKIATPLSMDDAQEQSDRLKELTSSTNKNSLDTFNPLSSNYQKSVMEAGAAGKVGIGAYSNDVVLHSLIRQNDAPIELHDEIVFGKLSSKKFGQDFAMKEDKLRPYYSILQTLKATEPEIFEDISYDNLLLMLMKKEDGKLVPQDKENLELAFSLIENTVLPLVTDEDIAEKIRYYKKDTRRVSQILTERQNIATDNAKELIMESAGINSETLDVDKVLVLLGFDKDISGNSIPFFFLNQPIIKEFISEFKNLDSKISEFVADKENHILNKLIEKYGLDPSPDNQKQILENGATYLTGAALEQQLEYFKDNNFQIKEGDVFQYAVLLQFLKLKKLGTKLRGIQKNFNVDSQGIGKSTFDLYDRINRLGDLAFDDSITRLFADEGPASLIGKFSKSPTEGYIKLDEELYVKPTTAVGHFTVNTLSAGVAITNKELPYNSNSMREVFDEIIDNSTVSSAGQVELKQDVVKNMKMYFNSINFDLYTGTSIQERRDLFIDNEETGHESLAKYLQEQLTNPNSKNFKFLNSIPLLKSFDFDVKRDGTPSIIKFNNTIDNYDENSLYTSLFLMLDKNLPLGEINGQTYTTRLLAQDLINYSLLQGGVQEAIQFNKFIPVAFLKNTKYASTLREINRDLNDGYNVFDVPVKRKNSVAVSNFTVQYFQHNPGRAPLVDLKNSAIKITAKDSKTKEVLEFEYKSKTKLPTFFRIYNGNANKNADLYMTNNGTTYFKISTLGMKAGMDSEYNMNVRGGEQFQESLIPSASEIAALRAKQVSATTRTEVKSEESSSDTSITNVFDVEGESLVQTMTKIAEDESLIKNENLIAMAKAIMPFLNPKTKFVTSTIYKDKNYEGLYDNEKNIIYIHPNFINKIEKSKDYDKLAKVILHEVIHSITVHELDNHLELDSNKQIVGYKGDAPAHVQELVRLFNNFKVIAEQGIEYKGQTFSIQKMNNKLEAQIPLTDFENNVIYAARNIREFLTLLGSSEMFQEYLHKTTYKKTKKSFFDKFKSIVNKMLKKLIKNLNLKLGISEKVESDFTEALEATFELIQEGDETRRKTFGKKLYSKLDAATEEFLDDVDSILGKKKDIQPATQPAVKSKPIKKDNPVQIDAKFPKDQVKADYADGIIGYGTHSTEKYAKAFGGTRTTFSPGETIMISVNGKNRPNQAQNVEKTKQAIDKAIASGVSFFIADNLNTANSSHNKSGEGAIREYLLSKGLEYENFNGVGLYSVKQPATQPVEIKGKAGVEISSNAKGLSAALTNPTELAKSKGNLANSYPIKFNGKTYKDVEAAYQALKDKSEAKTKPSKANSKNYKLMVDLIKTKLNQYPRLISEITKQGGSNWILSSTHQPTKQNSVWETGGQNWFIEALSDAYKATESTTESQTKIRQKILDKYISKIADETSKKLKNSTIMYISVLEDKEMKSKVVVNEVYGKPLGEAEGLKYFYYYDKILKSYIITEESSGSSIGVQNLFNVEKISSQKQVVELFEKYKNSKYSKQAVNAVRNSQSDVFSFWNTLQRMNEELADIKPVTKTKVNPLGAGFKKGEGPAFNPKDMFPTEGDKYDKIDPKDIDLSPIEETDATRSVEQIFDLRNIDGTRKKFLKKDYKKVLQKTINLNKANNNISFKFTIKEVMGEKGDRRTYYAIAVVPKNNVNFSSQEISKLDDLIKDFEKTCK